MSNRSRSDPRLTARMTIASFLGVLAGLVVRFAFYSNMFGGRRDQNTAVVLSVVMGVSPPCTC
ncbi:hypothetical protein GCM10027075_33890 [Streptomyces heilongjiangensis]